MMARMAKRTDGCPRWCDYADARNHPTNHVGHVGEVVSSVWPAGVIAVTVEAGRAYPGDPLPVVSLLRSTDGALVEKRVAWAEAEQLAGLLADAVKRHGPRRSD